MGYEFSSARGSGAFLIPGGHARQVARYLDQNTLTDYLLKHYSLISHIYNDFALDKHPVMILKGTTRVSAWCSGFAATPARGSTGRISINALNINIPTFRIDVDHNRAIANPVCSLPKIG